MEIPCAQAEMVSIPVNPGFSYLKYLPSISAAAKPSLACLTVEPGKDSQTLQGYLLHNS